MLCRGPRDGTRVWRLALWFSYLYRCPSCVGCLTGPKRGSLRMGGPLVTWQEQARHWPVVTNRQHIPFSIPFSSSTKECHTCNKKRTNLKINVLLKQKIKKQNGHDQSTMHAVSRAAVFCPLIFWWLVGPRCGMLPSTGCAGRISRGQPSQKNPRKENPAPSLRIKKTKTSGAPIFF